AQNIIQVFWFYRQFPNWLLENNTRLDIFIVNNNSFKGPFIVPYDILPNMLSIDISDNYLHGPIPTNLGLKMSRNEFQGSIPSSFGNLVFLQCLQLSENNISGTILMHFIMGCYHGQIFPTNFIWTNLRNLQLDNNHFSGTLPTWMGNMSFLEDIVMAKNHFEDPISTELCKLVDLRFLDLSDNNLFGSIPSCFNSTSIRIGSLSSLKILLLKENQLGDQIPIQLCLLQNLNILDLSYNKFSSPIPQCLSNITFDASVQENSLKVFFFSGPYSRSLSSYLNTKLKYTEDPNYETFVFDTC
ncbi:receptor-like protein 13, partial [Quercus suber]